MMLYKLLYTLILTLFTLSIASAQSDSTKVAKVALRDSTVKSDSNSSSQFGLFKPASWSKQEKAGIMSALLPGLGQAYNKKYWKMPIIYIAGGFCLASAIFHHQEYKVARDGLIDSAWTDSTYILLAMRGGNLLLRQPYTIGTENQYRTARDNERQKRDRYIVAAGLIYLLNIVDAVVDAHLSEFDLSDDLSLKINPNFYSRNNKFAAQVSFNFTFK